MLLPFLSLLTLMTLRTSFKTAAHSYFTQIGKSNFARLLSIFRPWKRPRIFFPFAHLDLISSSKLEYPSWTLHWYHHQPFLFSITILKLSWNRLIHTNMHCFSWNALGAFCYVWIVSLACICVSQEDFLKPLSLCSCCNLPFLKRIWPLKEGFAMSS